MKDYQWWALGMMAILVIMAAIKINQWRKE
jgi:hypothetical protein